MSARVWHSHRVFPACRITLLALYVVWCGDLFGQASSAASIAREIENGLAERAAFQYSGTRNADRTTAYADCLAAHVVDLHRGQQPLAAGEVAGWLQRGVTTDDWAGQLAKLPKCVFPTEELCPSGELDPDPAVSKEAQIAEVRTSLRELLPFVTKKQRLPATQNELFGAFCRARSSHVALESDLSFWATLQLDPVTRSYVAELLGKVPSGGARIQAAENAVKILAPSWGLSALDLAQPGKLRDASAKLEAWTLPSRDSTDHALSDLHALFALVGEQLQVAHSKLPTTSSSTLATLQSVGGGDINLFVAPTHCIVARRLLDADASIAFKLYISLPLSGTFPASVCSVPQPPALHLPIGLRFSGFTMGRDGQLLPPRPDRVDYMQDLSEIEALVRAAGVPPFVAISSVRIERAPGTRLHDDTLRVVAKYDLSLPGLGNSTQKVPGEFLLLDLKSRTADSIRTSISATVERLRGSVKRSMANWKVAVPLGSANPVFGLSQFAINDDPWTDGVLKVTAQLSRPTSTLNVLGQTCSMALNGPIAMAFEAQSGKPRLRMHAQDIAVGALDEFRRCIAGAAWEKLKTTIESRSGGKVSVRDLDVNIEAFRLTAEGTAVSYATLRFPWNKTTITARLKIDIGPRGGSVVFEQALDQITKQLQSALTDWLTESAGLPKLDDLKNRKITIGGLAFNFQASKLGTCAGRQALVAQDSFAKDVPVVKFGIECLPPAEAIIKSGRIDFQGAKLVRYVGDDPPSEVTTREALAMLLGVKQLPLGNLIAGAPQISSGGIEFSVDLKDVPYLGTVHLRSIRLAENATISLSPSELEKAFKQALQRAAESVLRDALKPVLGDLGAKLEVIAFPLLQADFTIKVDAKLGDFSVPLEVTLLPTFKVKDDPNTWTKLGTDLVAGPLLKAFAELLGMEAVDPRIESMQPFTLSFALKANVFGKNGVPITTPRLLVDHRRTRLKCRCEIPLVAAIPVPPVTIVNPTLILGEDPSKEFGVLGDVTLTKGTENAFKVRAEFLINLAWKPPGEQKGPKLHAEMTGVGLIVGTLELFRAKGEITQDVGVDFVAESGAAYSSLLKIAGNGSIKGGAARMHGSMRALGINFSRTDLVIGNDGTFLFTSSVDLLLGKAAAKVTATQFPNDLDFTGRLGLKVDRFELSEVEVGARATPARAHVGFKIFGTKLNVSGKSVNDLTPGRVLDAILALFNWKLEDLLKMKSAEISLGKPAGAAGDISSDTVGPKQSAAQSADAKTQPAAQPAANTKSVDTTAQKEPAKAPAGSVGATSIRHPRGQHSVTYVKVGASCKFEKWSPPLVPGTPVEFFPFSGSLPPIEKPISLLSNPDLETPGRSARAQVDGKPLNYRIYDPGAPQPQRFEVVTEGTKLFAMRKYVTRGCEEPESKDDIPPLYGEIKGLSVQKLTEVFHPWTLQAYLDRIRGFSTAETLVLSRAAQDALKVPEPTSLGVALFHDLRAFDLPESAGNQYRGRVYLWCDPPHIPCTKVGDDGLLNVSIKYYGFGDRPWSVPASSRAVSYFALPASSDDAWTKIIAPTLAQGRAPDLIWPDRNAPTLIWASPVDRVIVWHCPNAAPCVPIDCAGECPPRLPDASRGWVPAASPSGQFLDAVRRAVNESKPNWLWHGVIDRDALHLAVLHSGVAGDTRLTVVQWPNRLWQITVAQLRERIAPLKLICPTNAFPLADAQLDTSDGWELFLRR